MAPPTNSPSQRGHTVDRATQPTTPRPNPIISPRSTSHQENTAHSHDNMTHAIATAMDHLWQTRIQPSLDQQRDENRQCYDDIQIQLDSVRRSVTDSVRLLPSTSRSSALHHPTSTQFSPHHSPILSSLRDNESPTTIRTSRIRWEDNTTPPPPPHVTQFHHLPLLPLKHPLTNAVNDPLTSPHSSQVPVIHYSPKTILTASLANNPKNSLIIKSALSPINLNAISLLIQKTTNSSPKVPHFAN